MGVFSTHCASAYSYSGRLEEAERAYLIGTQHREGRTMAHENYALHYLRQRRWQDAKTQFEKAVESEGNPGLKAYYTGHMLVRLYPRDREKLQEARDQFEEALRLHPRKPQAQDWLNRLNNILGKRPRSDR